MSQLHGEMAKRVGEIRDRVSSIQGWLYTEEGACLYEMARFRAPVPVVAELGSWRGLSTAWIAYGLEDRQEGTVYAVDHWRGSPGEEAHRQILAGLPGPALYGQFCANIAGLGLSHRVKPLEGNTIEISRTWPLDRPIGLLFIDASHDYLSVRRDFEFWSPLVAEGGLVAFHDVPGWPGPTRVVSQLPAWFRPVTHVKNLWVGQKTSD